MPLLLTLGIAMAGYLMFPDTPVLKYGIPVAAAGFYVIAQSGALNI